MIRLRLVTLLAGCLPPRLRFWAARVALASILVPLVQPIQAEIQFDVFIGYDGITREAGWFPISCEVHNDGPPFKAVVEVTSGGYGADQTRQIAFELPTNTRKRFVIPVFSAGNRFASQWDARLLDERGKVRSERLGLSSKSLAWDSILLGAVPRNFGGLPSLPDIKPNRTELKPQVARLQLEQFPDNPIALEGLDALYLNSEKAIELKVNQIVALLGWIRSGGHLIVAVEQISDINGTPWLQQFLPISLSGMANQPIDQAILGWLRSDAESETIEKLSSLPAPKKVNPRLAQRDSNPYSNLPVDPAFIASQLPVATGTLRDGRILMGTEAAPLMVEANRGRGKVTVMMFSPEREPFRSWKSRPYFWARLLRMPNEWFTSTDFAAYGGWSVDGVFGALIDSRQVKKLPVEWLLLLLVVYLIVIGPFDQYWLKKINRQMLTWITFPSYVVFFSLLIYFIGYKLRAGETEWNELQIVDILPRGDEADLRGRTYASIYSSANAKYQLASDQPFATLRGELLDLFGGGGKEGSKAKMVQRGNGYRAEIFVPVWTSLLYASDWFQPDAAPLAAAVSGGGSAWKATIENLLDRPVTEARLVVDGLIFDLGTLAAKEKKTISLERSKGISLRNFIQQNGSGFQAAVEHRRDPLGNDRSGRLENAPLTATVASFCGQITESRKDYRSFIAPAGLDLSSLVQRGDAILLAWDGNHSFAPPINQFAPPRLKRNSFLRLAVPVKKTL